MRGEKDNGRTGNGRHEALEAMYAAGETVYLAPGEHAGGQPLPSGTVPYIDCTGWTAEQRKAYALADNRIAENATWDDSVLLAQLRELAGQELDMSSLGFGDQMVADLMRSVQRSMESDPDKEVEPSADIRVRPGDLFVLGDHKIICGSSTDTETVAALLGDEVPMLMVTDPPYGVEYDADWRNDAVRANGGKIGGRAIGKVMHDDRADWSDAWALFPGDVAYVWHAGNKAHIVAESLMASGLEIRAQIIWNKSNMVIGRGDYHPKHEPCWYAVRKGKRGRYVGGRKQTTVWDIDKPQKSETGHSTQKPVECMKRPVENNSTLGELVYEPFSGSGTTIIACEMTGRKCRAIELSPAYVDLAIRRWQEFAGQKAQRSDGQDFDDLETFTP